MTDDTKGQYNVFFVHDYAVFTTTVEANDEDHAQNMGERLLKILVKKPEWWRFDRVEYLCP